MLDHDRLARISILPVPHDVQMVDVMGGDSRRDVAVHNHGFVSLLDVMPRLAPEGHSADFAIVRAARVSYGAGTKTVSADRGLIRYLLRNWHTTPFEMVEFLFHCKMPLFVARQWIRHRTASVNELSGRYSIMPSEFFRPEHVRLQSTTNKQGGDEIAEDITAAEFAAMLNQAEALYPEYERLLATGVSRELARTVLPQTIMTEWYWKIDLHNLMHFLRLRMDSHAQAEIQEYARAIFALLEPILPHSMEAFVDYRMNSMQLSGPEIEAIRTGQKVGNRREDDALAVKLERLGFTKEN